MKDLISSFIEVTLPDERNFLKVKETLTRIGVGSAKTRTVYQSCHILHKRGKYFIVHFKEMFMLDGKQSDMDDSDIARRNRIAKLLAEWKLVDLKDPAMSDEPIADMSTVIVIPYSKKDQWTLKSKYSIGK